MVCCAALQLFEPEKGIMSHYERTTCLGVSPEVGQQAHAQSMPAAGQACKQLDKEGEVSRICFWLVHLDEYMCTCIQDGCESSCLRSVFTAHTL